jgi:hypothetical protein
MIRRPRPETIRFSIGTHRRTFVRLLENHRGDALRWEEIHGFQSTAEYKRFVAYIEREVEQGLAEEGPVDPDYGAGMLFGGRWFRDTESGTIWRLLPPDVPFRGLWEPVKR